MVLVSRMEPSGSSTQSVALPRMGSRRAAWLVVVQRWREQRQLAFGNGLVLSVFPDNRKWLAPVTLAGEQPVAQLVLDASLAFGIGFQPVDHLGLGFSGRKAVEEAGVDGDSMVGEGFLQGGGHRRLACSSFHIDSCLTLSQPRFARVLLHIGNQGLQMFRGPHDPIKRLILPDSAFIAGSLVDLLRRETFPRMQNIG